MGMTEPLNMFVCTLRFSGFRIQVLPSRVGGGGWRQRDSEIHCSTVERC